MENVAVYYIFADQKMIERHNVDCWKFIATLADQSIDHIITDPPYSGGLEMSELFRVCKGNVVVFCAPENQFFVPDEYAFWIKQPSTKNFAKHLGRFIEMILISRGKVFNAGLHWSNYTGVYDDRLLTKQVHPFEKPVSLLERLVAIYTNPGDKILDPFMGCGSTLKAAHNLGRNAIGCEINPEWFKLSEGIGA
jgi:DNA modification methylase